MVECAAGAGCGGREPPQRATGDDCDYMRKFIQHLTNVPTGNGKGGRVG